MKRIKIGRENISISKIGKKRFWIGILIGVLVAIVISIFFNHSRETLRYFTSINADLHIPTSVEFKIYDFFFSSISVSIGLVTTLWIWMENRNLKNYRKRKYSRLAQVTILLTIWVTLMVISRFGSLISFVVYGFGGYDNYLNFATDYQLLLVLFPIVIFLQSWYIIRLIYKTNNWILYSFGFLLLFTSVLSYTTDINHDKINKPYHNLFKNEYTYTENQVKYAEENYHIHFNEQTIKNLKKHYSMSTIKLVEEVKNEFSKKSVVPMKQIILEKIIIHNLKKGHFKYRRDPENWRFALPIEIYNQIIIHEIDDDETKELFLILNEQIKLWNSPEIDWNHYEKYTRLDLNRSNFRNNNYPKIIIKQLKKVRKDILSNNNYQDYHDLLPRIQSNNY